MKLSDRGERSQSHGCRYKRDRVPYSPTAHKFLPLESYPDWYDPALTRSVTFKRGTESSIRPQKGKSVCVSVRPRPGAGKDDGNSQK